MGCATSSTSSTSTNNKNTTTTNTTTTNTNTNTAAPKKKSDNQQVDQYKIVVDSPMSNKNDQNDGGAGGAGGVKEDLSRMEGAYGARVIKNLKKMRVFLCGLRGVGIETAKNLILAGPKAVVVHDDEMCEIADLGCNFYLTEDDVGKPRAQACVAKLQDLNPNTSVSLHAGDLPEEYLANFDVVVFADRTPVDDLVRYNAFCRAATRVKQQEKRDQEGRVVRDKKTGDPVTVDVLDADGNQVMEHYIRFIYANIDGVTGTVFSDFGPAHVCFDDDGTQPANLIVERISNDTQGVVTVADERHGLHTGDRVRLEEVVGMNDESVAPRVFGLDEEITDINQTLDVKFKNARQFFIGDTTKLGKYDTGGVITQVKVERVFSHNALGDELEAPSFIYSYNDFTKLDQRNEHLHLARRAIWKFQSESGDYPKLHDSNDANAVLEHARALNDAQKGNAALYLENMNEDMIVNCALTCRTELCGMAALFGGVVAQEILKQAGKYTPISQWFYFDAFELLSSPTVRDDAKPMNSRYDHQIALFGRDFQKRVGKQKYFVVGVGALGCEYLKMVALTGLGCDGGEIHITDDDHVELSNLSRQFLFRRKHVNQPKSVSAGSVVGEMNPAVNDHLVVHETKVEPATEHIFNDKFWSSLDFVVNALDNNKAREYTDGKCVLFHTPLFESGTLGTRANTVIVRPNHTPSYSQGAVAGEGQGIAMCTLRNFPSLPIHCIEWARQMFDQLFMGGPEKYADFRNDPGEWLEKNRADPTEELDNLRTVANWMDLAADASYERCVEMAYREFERRYTHAIKDLTHAYPRDAKRLDGEGNVLGPFWHGKHRYPNEAAFDANVDEHMDYVYAAASIFAFIFNIKEESRERARELAAKVEPKEWTPSNVKIETEEDEEKDDDDDENAEAGDEDAGMNDEEERELAELRERLSVVDKESLKPVTPAEFEKDDDTNHHIDWITVACNMRCENYNIKKVTRQKCRMTAGRIIPAIATTTACITGFVTLELYKHLINAPLESHRAATIDLGTNVYVLENLPDPVYERSTEDVPCYPEKISVWDQIVIDSGDITVGEFMEKLSEAHHGVSVAQLWKGGLTEKDIKEGRGQSMYSNMNPFAGTYRMHSMLAKRPNNSAEKQAVYQQTIDNYESWAKKYEGVPEMKLSQRFVELYGEPEDPDRGFCMLSGMFKDSDGVICHIPSIKFVFKK